ncbi:MAG: ISL3 family transposase, partial [Legionellaceae bacterium]|nr:ISL3 family transposase [Legionellaceae bacterium]
MPKFNVILNLPGFSIKKVGGYQPLLLDVNYNRLPRCAHCNSKAVRKKDSFIRTVHHELMGYRRTLLRFKAYKLFCNACRRYGNQRFPGIAKHQRSTERLQAQVFHQHTYGVSQKTLSQQFKKGKATIEPWYQRKYQLENQEKQNAACPTVLGIDEHFFSRKQGFATTLCDLRKHKIYDIVKGRSEPDLNGYLSALKGKDRVQVVCMDLSTTYRAIIKKHFPNAKIVADRFHVIRLLQHQCMMTYRELSSKVKSNRGILAVLRTNPKKLTARKRLKLEAFLIENPAIAAIYQFQQELHELLMRKTLNQNKCKELIPIFLEKIKALKQSPFKALASLGRTLYRWRDEIVRMWRFSKTNGITEGFHRKMKLIQRRAYGFR